MGQYTPADTDVDVDFDADADVDVDAGDTYYTIESIRAVSYFLACLLSCLLACFLAFVSFLALEGR